MRFVFTATVLTCFTISAFAQAPPCTIQTIAGPPTFFSGDGGPATSAYFHSIRGFRFSPSGDLFIADSENNRIRKVTPDGIVTTIAGVGLAGFSGDGGLATSAQLDLPLAVSPDAQGNLYIVESDNRIRKVDSSGIITTFAGNGTPNFSGDGGPATSAEIQTPSDVIADALGNVFIADAGNFRVREVNPQGIISTVAGTGVDQPYYIYPLSTPFPRQLGGPATAYSFENPASLALDAAGNLYIADPDLLMVFKVDSNGVITDFAGNGQLGNSPLGLPATSGEFVPAAIAFDSSGNLAISSPVSSNGGIFSVSPAGVVSLLSPDIIDGIAFDQSILYSSFGSYSTSIDSIYSVAANTLYAGVSQTGTSGDGGPSLAARFQIPGPMAIDPQGNIYVVDVAPFQIRKVATDGTITHFAGNSTDTYSGDGGPAAQAGLGDVQGITSDLEGNIYISDGSAVREIDTQGTISMIFQARNGSLGKLAIDPSGNFYAGEEDGVFVFSSEGVQQSLYPFAGADGIFPWTLDPNGNFYWVLDGVINRLNVDGTSSMQSLPEFQYGNLNLVADAAGDVIFSNGYLTSLRELTSDGRLITLANQNAALPYATGPASQVDLGDAASLIRDAVGDLYYTDTLSSNVRELTAGCPVTAQPIIPEGGVANAASYNPGNLAAGELTAIFGEGLGPSTGAVVPVDVNPTGEQFPTQYEGVSVTVNGYPAPLLYVSQSQVNFVTPFEVEGQRDRTVQITYNGVSSDPYFENEVETDPGVFVIANPDYSANSASNAATSGSYVIIYGTGTGASDPPQTDGAITIAAPATPLIPITALIDGLPATVLYAGAAPGLVAGVLQVNLQLPAQIAPGQHTLLLSAGDWNNSAQKSLLFTQ